MRLTPRTKHKRGQLISRCRLPGERAKQITERFIRWYIWYHGSRIGLAARLKDIGLNQVLSNKTPKWVSHQKTKVLLDIEYQLNHEKAKYEKKHANTKTICGSYPTD